MREVGEAASRFETAAQGCVLEGEFLVLALELADPFLGCEDHAEEGALAAQGEDLLDFDEGRDQGADIHGSCSGGGVNCLETGCRRRAGEDVTDVTGGGAGSREWDFGLFAAPSWGFSDDIIEAMSNLPKDREIVSRPFVLGREKFAAISAVEGLKLTPEGEKRLKETEALSPEERRAVILRAFAEYRKR